MKTETYSAFEIEGVEIIGAVGKSGNFLVMQIHDIEENRAYCFDGCSVLDFAKNMDNTFIEDVSVTIKDDTYILFSDGFDSNLPPVATQPIPLDGADKRFLMTLIETVRMATEVVDEDEPDYELAPLSMDY